MIAAVVATGCGGDNAAQKFGRVSIPGEQTVELDKGSYGVFYQEADILHRHGALSVPFGLDIEVKGVDGAPTPNFDLEYSYKLVGGGAKSREIGVLTIPADGRYSVVVAPNKDAAERSSHVPAITIGRTVAADKSYTAYFVIGGGLLVLFSVMGQFRSWMKKQLGSRQRPG